MWYPMRNKHEHKKAPRYITAYWLVDNPVAG